MKLPPEFKQLDTTALVSWQVQMRQAAESPWLAALLLKRARLLLQRLTYFHQELRNLPRCWRRKLQKLLATGLVGAALMLAFSPTPSVNAATITVDGVCTLTDAIIAANTDTATGSCPAGSGADIIDLQTNVTLGAPLYSIVSPITIEGNGFTIDSNGVGRAFHNTNSGNLTLNDVIITGGDAPIGGGVLNDGTLIVNRSTFYGNTGGNGGGIHNNNGTVTLNDSTLSGNQAMNEGGGIFNIGNSSAATVTLNNSTISGNSATNRGGGVFNYGYNDTATVTLNNSTVTGNSSSKRGGGIYNFAASSGTPITNLNRTILSGNIGSAGDEFFNRNGTVNANNYNILGENGNNNNQAFSGFSPCSGGGCTDLSATSNGTDPTAIGSILNTTLADNGGPTFTHALIGGSLAINTVPTTDSNCNPGTSVDQRGAARANGTSQGGAACDSGAYEVSAESPTAITHQNITTNSGTTQTSLIAALLAGFSAVTLAIYLRVKSTADNLNI